MLNRLNSLKHKHQSLFFRSVKFADLIFHHQTKDRALADLEVHNQHLNAELRSLQDDLAVQEEELAYQQRS